MKFLALPNKWFGTPKKSVPKIRAKIRAKKFVQQIRAEIRAKIRAELIRVNGFRLVALLTKKPNFLLNLFFALFFCKLASMILSTAKSLAVETKVPSPDIANIIYISG